MTQGLSFPRLHPLRRVIFEMESGETFMVDGVFITRAEIVVGYGEQRNVTFDIHGAAPFVGSRYNKNDPYIDTGYTEAKQLKG